MVFCDCLLAVSMFSVFICVVPLPHLHLHSSAKLSHPAVDTDGSGQGLEAEIADIFRKNELGRPVLVFLSLVPSSSKGEGLDREGTTSGAVGTFGREEKRSS